MLILYNVLFLKLFYYLLTTSCSVCLSYKWLTKYSIKKLKLELPRLFGPGCTHQKKTVDSLHKKVSAKYCHIFPSVEIKVSFCWCHLPTSLKGLYLFKTIHVVQCLWLGSMMFPPLFLVISKSLFYYKAREGLLFTTKNT